MSMFALSTLLEYSMKSVENIDTATLLLINAVISISIVILFLRILYLAWQVIGDRLTRPTAGYAVGFLLVPLFNIYWQFKAFASYPTQFTLFTKRHGLDVEPPSRWPYITYCIFPFITLPLYFMFPESDNIAYTVIVNIATAFYYTLALIIYYQNIQAYNRLLSSSNYPKTLRTRKKSILYE